MTGLLSVVAIVRAEASAAPFGMVARGSVPGQGVTPEIAGQLLQMVSAEQLEIIEASLEQLRRVFSRRIAIDLSVWRASADELARIHVASAAQSAAFDRNGVAIALFIGANFEGSHMTGRPDDGPIEIAFKNALSQATYRIVRLGLRAGDGDLVLYERAYEGLGNRLQAHDSLFNLNSGHHRQHAFAVRHYCEENGPSLLAAAYGVGADRIEALLDAAFTYRLRKHSFSSALESEMSLVETLTIWAGALRTRAAGEASRRDTVRRLLRESGHTWQTAPGEVTPPRMSRGVARNLVTEQAMHHLSLRAMVEAALLFDLEPAFDLFPSRRFALPILAMAAFAGKLGWRRQPSWIEQPVLALGLIALVEERGFANADVTGLAGEGDSDDELGMDLAYIERSLRSGGLSPHQLHEISVSFIQDGMARPVMPARGPARFFVDED